MDFKTHHESLSHLLQIHVRGTMQIGGKLNVLITRSGMWRMLAWLVILVFDGRQELSVQWSRGWELIHCIWRIANFSSFSSSPHPLTSSTYFHLSTAAQIILLPNLHTLRAENIIRSHKVKVEVRDRPVKRISYFSSAFNFPILNFLHLLPPQFYSLDPIIWIHLSRSSGTSQNTAKGEYRLTLCREFQFTRPSLEGDFWVLVRIDILLLCF